MRFLVVMELGGCRIQLSLPSLAMPNSATHLRVGVVSWYEFNEMEKSGPSNFIHVNLAQTHWTSSLPDFPLQRNIEWVALFFCFVSKGSNQFETQLGFTRRLKVNQALDILSGKKRRRFLYLWSSLWSWRTFDSTLGINAVTLPKNKNKAYLCIRSKAY